MLARRCGAAALLLVTLAPALRAQGRAPSYEAAQFRCVRVHERVTSEVTTETGTRRATARTGRDGALVLAGRPDSAGIDLLAWYDRLAVWRVVGEDSVAAVTDGILGGRFRGTLLVDGTYRGRARPYVPDGVQELSDVGAALDDLLPRLPPRLLQVGEEWRAGDSLAIQRLADSAGLERYRVQRTTEGRVLPAPGDTLTPPFERVLRDRGTLAWDDARGVVRYDRRIEVEALVPVGGAVRRAVRTMVVQRALVERQAEDPRACAGLRTDD